MRRALVVLVLLALPASASAAPFGELPFRPVSGAATCLRATGAPAELVRWVRDGAEVLVARPEGLVPQATVPLGALQGCPSMASEAGGAAVIAGPLRTGVRVAVREPGGGWGAPITFPARNIGAVDVAVSARGDAVVAWEQDVTLTEGRARVVRRSAGGAFGAPEQVASVPADISVGMAADGATTVMLVGERDVRVTSAPLGSAFGATRRLLRRWFGADFPELAVAADGRVLVAAPDDDGLVLFERPPGGELERVSAIPDVRASELALALRPGGAAAIGWKGGLQVGAIVRDGPGAFGPPVVVAEDEPVNGSNAITLLTTFGPQYELEAVLRLALGADGRALLGWAFERRGVQIATVTSSGASELRSLGSPIRAPTGITPLVLDGGARAVAWADNNGIFSVPPFAGRLHLALEGVAATPDAPAPRVTVGAPRDRTLRPAQPLRLPIRCSAACDVRASLAGQPFGSTVSLSRAGTALLRFQPSDRALAPRRPGAIEIDLRWSAPGARSPARRTARVRLRRLPAPPLPRIENLRARRRPGGVVEVRWSTDVPARDAFFTVLGTRTADPQRDRDPVARGVAASNTRRSFGVRLREARGVRYVHVTVIQPIGPRFRTVSASLS